MDTLGDIDPKQREPESVSENYYTHRLHKREPYYNKNVILPGELITFTLPNLDTDTLMAQNTWCMTYDLELTGKKDDKQFVVWNLEKSIVDVLRVKIKNETGLLARIGQTSSTACQHYKNKCSTKTRKSRGRLHLGDNSTYRPSTSLDN